MSCNFESSLIFYFSSCLLTTHSSALISPFGLIIFLALGCSLFSTVILKEKGSFIKIKLHSTPRAFRQGVISDFRNKNLFNFFGFSIVDLTIRTGPTRPLLGLFMIANPILEMVWILQPLKDSYSARALPPQFPIL